jgi:hypothetical protein
MNNKNFGSLKGFRSFYMDVPIPDSKRNLTFN